MRKRNLSFSQFIFCFFLFLLSSTVVAGGSNIINSLSRQYFEDLNKKEAKSKAKNNARKKYLAAARACKGIKRARGKGKVVALTFDDGPNGKYTDEVLRILLQNDIKATFFFIGKNVENQQNIVRSAYAQGHVIGNHSYSHGYLARLSQANVKLELERTSDLIEQALGVRPLLFRPPYGSCSDQSTAVANSLDFNTIMWSAMVDDYNPHTTPKKIADGIIGLVTPGTIIGLHDGGGNRTNTITALPLIISNLKRRGYEFLTIPELLSLPAYSYPGAGKILIKKLAKSPALSNSLKN